MSQTKTKRQYDFFQLLEKFISDSRRGKRLQPNGKRISGGTLKNYLYLQKLLEQFCQAKKFDLRIRDERALNSRDIVTEQNYWKKFYKRFTDYLYGDLGYFDNYVGLNIRNLKTFFNYLNKETAIKAGNFHQQFYVHREDIAVFALMPEELNFLIYNKKFENSLSGKMKEVKDVVVFGCTVALRVSDLISLRKSSVRVVNETYYLAVRSKKSNTDSLIKLPDYCINIILKYKSHCKDLLPKFGKSNLNSYIKTLFEIAGLTHEVLVQRHRRGKPVVLKNGTNKTRPFRFCDIASTHTMRRTAITTMLCLGMQEQLVRKISGHAPGSREFYRYVLWAQTYMDDEVAKVFEKLKGKELLVA